MHTCILLYYNTHYSTALGKVKSYPTTPPNNNWKYQMIQTAIISKAIKQTPPPFTASSPCCNHGTPSLPSASHPLLLHSLPLHPLLLHFCCCIHCCRIAAASTAAAFFAAAFTAAAFIAAAFSLLLHFLPLHSLSPISHQPCFAVRMLP